MNVTILILTNLDEIFGVDFLVTLHKTRKESRSRSRKDLQDGPLGVQIHTTNGSARSVFD